MYAFDLPEKTFDGPNGVTYLANTWFTHVVRPLVSRFSSFLKVAIKIMVNSHTQLQHFSYDRCRVIPVLEFLPPSCWHTAGVSCVV